MKKYVRAVFDELQRKSDGRVAAQQNSAPGSGRGRQVARPPSGELVREDGEGDGLLGAGVDPKIGRGTQVETGKKVA
jgi:hypothetical protein